MAVPVNTEPLQINSLRLSVLTAKALSYHYAILKKFQIFVHGNQIRNQNMHYACEWLEQKQDILTNLLACICDTSFRNQK